MAGLTFDRAARCAFAGVLGLAMAVAAVAPARAQLVTTLVDRDGVSLPCVTVGPLAPVAQEYCVRRTLKFGWLRKSELGANGLSVDDSGRIGKVAPQSAAALAGVQVGDRLISVDGHPVRTPPAEIAQRMLFGAASRPVKLTLTRDGQPLERSFGRTPVPEPADAPHSPNILLGIHPLMNWRGEFVPCMGAGVLGPVAVAACTAKMERVGFVHADALGDAGVTFDPGRLDAAVVAATAPASPAAAADVRAGDTVTAIDGRALEPQPSHDAQALLFGKIGDTRRVSLERSGQTMTVALTLVAGP